MTLRNLIFLILISVIVWQCQADEIITIGPGVTAPEAPKQTDLHNAETFEYGDYLITPLADFSLTAKVLSREDYFFDRESELAATDLALGWQQMSDESVLSQIRITQSNRWYHWQVKTLPIPRRAIETQSANMHMVAANEDIAAVLDQVQPGQLIHLEGQLIRAESYDGWYWQSSLTREDTGDRACELVYVTALDILAP